MLKLLGIFNIILVTIGLFFLAGKDKSYSFLKDPISSIAKHKNNRHKFIALLSTFALLQIIFAYVCLIYIKPSNEKLLTLLFFCGGIIFLISAFTTYYLPRIHRYLTWLSVIIISVGMLVLSSSLFIKFPYLIATLFIATILLTLSTQYIRIIKNLDIGNFHSCCL